MSVVNPTVGKQTDGVQFLTRDMSIQRRGAMCPPRERRRDMSRFDV